MLHPFRLSEDLRVDRRLHVPHASPNRKQRKAGLEKLFKNFYAGDVKYFSYFKFLLYLRKLNKLIVMYNILHINIQV